MASSVAKFALRSYAPLFRRTALSITVNPTVNALRGIATTEKKRDGAVGLSIPHDGVSTKPIGGAVDTDYVNRKKDWMTRGMDMEDEDIDRWYYMTCGIYLITLMTCLTIWYHMYIPNANWPNRDWVMREAYLELHRREKFGLPLVDPDLIARETIALPSEEDLEDFEVTI